METRDVFAVISISVFLTLSLSLPAMADRAKTMNALENALNNSIVEAKVNIDKSESRTRTPDREIQSDEDEPKLIKIEGEKVDVE